MLWGKQIKYLIVTLYLLPLFKMLNITERAKR